MLTCLVGEKAEKNEPELSYSFSSFSLRNYKHGAQFCPSVKIGKMSSHQSSINQQLHKNREREYKGKVPTTHYPLPIQISLYCNTNQKIKRVIISIICNSVGEITISTTRPTMYLKEN
ncbi:hypothetical protein CIPAW_04G065500 [Carya illinoinensis]|uniref:Uncharacterized protein n=1 Tax=Carya illinoinensis TaxID=32201 RepID=A0A8T1QSA6_CARIL|nr:hypothetical protein CIPAW_04G065500 [Carya illinoinensis]